MLINTQELAQSTDRLGGKEASEVSRMRAWRHAVTTWEGLGQTEGILRDTGGGDDRRGCQPDTIVLVKKCKYCCL